MIRICSLILMMYFSAINADFVRLLPSLNQVWMNAFAAADWDALCDLYVQDNDIEPSSITPPSAPTFFGVDGVRQVFGGAFDAGIKKVELHISYARQLSFDHGFERSRYLFSIADGTIVDEGHYQVWWERTVSDSLAEPKWKLHSDMFSSSITAEESGQPLDVSEQALKEWSSKFLACFSAYNYKDCREIVSQDIRTWNLNTDEVYISQDFQYFVEDAKDNRNAFNVCSDREYDEDRLLVKKVAQNEVQINYDTKNGNSMEIHAYIDFSIGTAWKLTFLQKSKDD